MTDAVALTLRVNGEEVRRAVEPRETLVDFLRRELQLTGTHAGCEMGACGACLVLLDDRPVHACLVFAVQADGASVETVEGLTDRAAIADLQQAFHARNALQCGFCTPGMIMSAVDMVNRHDRVLDEHTVREELEGNICRCTGYHNIVKAIQAGAENM